MDDDEAMATLTTAVVKMTAAVRARTGVILTADEVVTVSALLDLMRAQLQAK